MTEVINDISNILQKTGYKINAFASDIKDGDSVSYILIPSSSDGIKEQYRLETTIVSNDFVRAVKMLDDVKNALLTIADTQKTNNILNIELNGGGNMVNYETNTYHLKAFFAVKSKKR